MTSEKLTGKQREMPHTHELHIFLPIIFVIVWMLDSNFLNWSTFLNQFVPFWIRLICFICLLALSFTIIYSAHNILFHDNEPSEELINTGILAHVRNPLYSGIIIIYIALISFSYSLISLLLFIPIFLIYNKMVNYEEIILENIFGESYLDYKKKVPKWIPSPRKRGYFH